MGFDMHVHSTASDGVFTPKHLVRWAKELGLEGLAITDHDTVAGLAVAAAAGQQENLPVIPGIELSCEYEPPLPEAGHEVHILGYFVDYNNQEFLEKLAFLQQKRLERARQMLCILRENAMPLDEKMLAAYADEGAIGRAVIARKMVEAGYVESMNDAFAKWLGKGQKAFLPRVKVQPEQAISMIRQAGGAAVMAHPLLAELDSRIGILAKAGLAGLEVYHPTQDEAASQHYFALAQEFDLIATGGSDCHEGRLGFQTTSRKNLQKLWQRRG